MHRLKRLRAGLTVAAACAAWPHGAVGHPLDAAGRPPPVGWTFEPWVVACLGASALLYAVGVARLWRHAGHGRGVHPGRVVAFALGWLALVAALVSPLDALGTRLFAAHMVQHEMLMVIAAPLLVVARPLAAWAWALPPAARRGAGRFFHTPAWRGPWLVLTSVGAGWALHAAALWLWHLPVLFDAALASHAIHALQHASFLGTALLFWWTVLGSTTRRDQGIALVSLFTTMVHTGALGALLTLAPHVFYEAYVRTAPAWGLDPIEDQQLGGLVMWIPAGFAYVGVGLLLAARWIGDARPRPQASRAHEPSIAARDLHGTALTPR